jgi:signal transduction histidine kinase
VQQFLQKRPWAGSATGAFALLLLVAILDYVSRHQPSLTFLYALPVVWALWRSGTRTALLLAFAGTAVWLGLDLLCFPTPRSALLLSWEISVRTVFFFAVAIAGGVSQQREATAQARIESLERTQQLEHQVIAVSEYEQKRIGRDLHDGLCQYLAAVACSATTLQHELQKRALPDLAKTAGDLVQLVSNSVIETRNLSHGLMPVEIGHGGLGAALQQLADSTSRLMGVHCTFEHSGDELTHHDLHATHLVRIAQEAINNASRHGGAKEIEVLLTTNEHAATLSVTDDGIGIGQAQASTQGVGMSIMRYRAAALGGELLVEDRFPHGTIVSCTAPAPLKEAA